MTQSSSTSFPLTACLLCLALASAGCGEGTEARHRRIFNSVDRDRDGQATQAEFNASAPTVSPIAQQENFRKADEDGNGQLTFTEFESTLDAWRRVFWTLGVFSAVSFVGSLIAIPIVVARLPVDHFVSPHEAADWLASSGTRRIWLVLKNLLGLILVVGGIIMLVLPGQGVLTILLGIALTDFPGKWRMMRALARRPNVMKAINWMRERAEKPPLLSPLKLESQLDLPLQP